jgi:LysR family glycine cleavage system transcriptional activator
VRIEHLLDDSFFPVCSPRIAGGVPQRPADLARYPLLRSDNEPWKPWFEAAGLDWPEPTRGPIFNDSSHMMQAAAEREGIALGRATLLANDERNGVLVRPFAIAVPAPRRFYLVYPPRSADLPKLATFRAWLRAEVAADRKADAALRRGSARAPSLPKPAAATRARGRR